MIKKALAHLRGIFSTRELVHITLQEYISLWKPDAVVDFYNETRTGRLPHQVFRSKGISFQEWEQLMTDLHLRNQGWFAYRGTSYGLKGVNGIKQYTSDLKVEHLYVKPE